MKTPKLYFCDPGLAAWLLNVREVGHLMAHPARGSLFENLVVIEAIKHFYHRGATAPLYFYRDAHGTEVDLIVERGEALHLAEVKGGMTVTTDLTKNLAKVGDLLGARVRSKALLYGGDEAQRRTAFDVFPWQQVDRWLELTGRDRAPAFEG